MNLQASSATHKLTNMCVCVYYVGQIILSSNNMSNFIAHIHTYAKKKKGYYYYVVLQ